MTINNRIDLIISHLKMNNNSFSKVLEVDPTVIHNIRKGRNMPSYQILYKIALSFDNINMNWLITGKGNMLVNGAAHLDDSAEKHTIDPDNCEKCKLKDQIISLLRESQDILKEQVVYLKNKGT